MVRSAGRAEAAPCCGSCAPPRTLWPGCAGTHRPPRVPWTRQPRPAPRPSRVGAPEPAGRPGATAPFSLGSHQRIGVALCHPRTTGVAAGRAPSDPFCSSSLHGLLRPHCSLGVARPGNQEARRFEVASAGATTPPRLTAPGPELISRVWSGRWDSNPRLQPWQGCALPLSYARAPAPVAPPMLLHKAKPHRLAIPASFRPLRSTSRATRPLDRMRPFSHLRPIRGIEVGAG